VKAEATSALVAVAGFWRSPRLRANQAFALGMLTVATMQIANTFTTTADQGSVQMSWARIALLAEGLGPACWLFFSLTYARAHTTKLSGKAGLGVALLVLIPLVIAFFAWEKLLIPPLDSYEPGRYLVLGSWGYLFVALTLVACIAPLINLEATLRASAAVGRWQIKFMLLGIGLLIGFEIYELSYRLLFSFIDFSMIGPRAVIAIAASGLMAVSLMRAREGTVELSISQTALFRSVTLLFIGCYLIAVGIFTHFWSLIGGSNSDILQGMLVLVAIVGLATLLLSSRFNARVKLALSRHFYSDRYDYRQEWLQLNERMGAHLGLESSLGVAVERLSEALSAPHVSAWLFDETGQRLHLDEPGRVVHPHHGQLPTVAGAR